MRYIRLLFAVFILVGGTFAVLAQTSEPLEPSLQQKLIGKTFVFRNFYTNSKLDFDGDGKLKNKPSRDCWLRAGIRVDKVTLNKGHLWLSGKRSISAYNPKTRQLTAGEVNGDEKVEVEVDFMSDSPDRPTIARTLERVFLTGKDNLPQLIPSAYQSPDLIPAAQVQIVGGGVTPPRAIYTPAPEYAEYARQMRYQGDFVLGIVVGTDGRVKDIQVVKCLGLGLDQNAIDAVRNWEFKPATRDGKPVPVRINVDVSFHLEQAVSVGLIFF